MLAFIDKFSAGVESLLTLDTYDEDTSKGGKKHSKESKESKKEQASVAKAPTKT